MPTPPSTLTDIRSATMSMYLEKKNRFLECFRKFKKNVDGAMHFIYSHKYNTNSAEDSSDMN